MIAKRTALQAALLICATAAAPWAWAQVESYPSKPIRLIVPFAAGGPADVVAREVALSLGKEFKHPVMVENMGGGAGVPALNTVSRSSNDGYTLLFAASGNVVIQPLLAKKRVDILTLLTPVSLVTTSPHVLVVSGKLPVRTVKEFTDYAKAHPGAVNFASAGVGGLAHLASELFIRAAGIDARHVPYKGSSMRPGTVSTGRLVCRCRLSNGLARPCAISNRTIPLTKSLTPRALTCTSPAPLTWLIEPEKRVRSGTR